MKLLERQAPTHDIFRLLRKDKEVLADHAKIIANLNRIQAKYCPSSKHLAQRAWRYN